MTVVAVAEYGSVSCCGVPGLFQAVKTGTDLAYWECVGKLLGRGKTA